jgi:photosystem II stability/assembly factor-like uncharacterized protein
VVTAGAAVAATPVAPPAPKKSPSVPYRWRSVEIMGGGFVTGIEFSRVARDLVYARTDIGGAYRLNPKDDSWIPLTDVLGHENADYMGIESIAPDPVEADRVYMAVGLYTQSWGKAGGFMRSTDRGEHWEIIPTPGLKMGGNEEGRGNGERLVVDPNDTRILFFGSRRSGMWKSPDRASTWAQVESFPVKDDPTGFGIPIIIFDKSSGTAGKPTPTLFAFVSKKDTNIYRSDDAGATWAPVPKQPTGLVPTHAELDVDGSLYISYGANPGPSNVPDGAVWKLDTKSGAWTDITPMKPGADLGGGNLDKFGYSAITLDRQHPGTLITATIDRWGPGGEIFRTRDGGKHWTALAKQATFDAGRAKWLVNDPTEKMNPVQWVGDIEIDPFNPDHAYFTTGGGVWMSKDLTAADKKAGTHWLFANKDLEETAVLEMASPPEGAQLLTAVGDICGFFHKDIDVSPLQFRDPRCANATGLDFAGKKPSVVARVGSYNWDGVKLPRGAVSNDGGATWTRFRSEPKGSGGSGNVAVSADGAVIIWSSRGTGAARSTDHGKTWTPVEGLGELNTLPDYAPWYIRIAADRVNPQKFYAYLTLDGDVFASTDGGAHFTRSPAGASNLPEYGLSPASIRATPGIEGDVWITAGKALMHSTDSGKTYDDVAGVQEAYAVGFGKPLGSATYPTLYLSGKIGGEVGLFRSENAGKSFVRINDDAHQFGGSFLIIGDPRVAGRVYTAGSGRGVLVGEPK